MPGTSTRISQDRRRKTLPRIFQDLDSRTSWGLRASQAPLAPCLRTSERTSPGFPQDLLTRTLQGPADLLEDLTRSLDKNFSRVSTRALIEAPTPPYLQALHARTSKRFSPGSRSARSCCKNPKCEYSVWGNSPLLSSYCLCGTCNILELEPFRLHSISSILERRTCHIELYLRIVWN